MSYQSKSNLGLATLEAALLMSVLAVSSIGAVALSYYIQSAQALTQIVDKYLYDHAPAGFLFNGSGSIEPDIAALNSFVDQTQHDLNNALSLIEGDSAAVSSGNYFIEVTYAVLAVDSVSGATDPNAPYLVSPYSYASTSGTAALVGKSVLSPDLSEYFLRDAQSGRFSIASAQFGKGGNQFLPNAILLGARVFYKIDLALINYVFNLINQSPVISRIKVVPLRAQLE